LLVSWVTPPLRADDPKPAAKEGLSETKHVLELPAGKLEYTATTGLMPLRNDKGEITANIFFVAYTKADETNLTKRPVTFAFNGGPGSSAVWLHLGVLGPRRVVTNEDGSLPPPPYRLVDNEATLLDAQ